MWLGDSIDLRLHGNKCRVYRDGALYVSFLLAFLIAWQGWNELLFLLPAALGCFAVKATITCLGIEAEYKRRIREEYGPNRFFELEFQENRLRAHRNDSLFLALVLATVMGWHGWNRSFLLVPAIIVLYGAIAHLRAHSIAAELKRHT
jgi:hypothetical protein